MVVFTTSLPVVGVWRDDRSEVTFCFLENQRPSVSTRHFISVIFPFLGGGRKAADGEDDT
jgi:hypothetical protein